MPRGSIPRAHKDSGITDTVDMTIEELYKKVERLRMLTEGKMEYLRDHSKSLDQAFEELKEVTEDELDLVLAKIKEMDERMDLNGLSK